MDTVMYTFPGEVLLDYDGLKVPSEDKPLFEERVRGTFRDDTTPNLLTIQEVGALIRLRYPAARKWVRNHVTPIGGTVRVGNKLLVHAWALNEVLDQKKQKVKPLRDRVQIYQKNLHLPTKK